ncbi:MAG: ABC transporter substrate-binding protein [Deltaproteobacteria bacterium]|nr:ABC transporter substrate-binding protein [Deltaproteobacteria bacterium]
MKISNFRFLFTVLVAFCVLHLASLVVFANAQEGVKKDRYAIGVILPLSGRFADFGEEALKGVLLAAEIFKSAEQRINAKEIPNSRIEIIIKDSMDNAVAASNAVRELAEDEGVAAIIGPLISITAFEAAKKAQELKIPIITLSQREGLPQIGDYVFRNFMTQSLQARLIARYAVNTLKLKRIAILYPDNPYGRGLAAPFKDEIKIHNANVLTEEVYSDGQTDFSREIRKLFKIKETEKKEGRRTIKTFEPTVSIDALYIPDYFDTVSLIVSHLAYFNIKGIKLLGSNGWNSKKLIEMSGKYVEDSVFVDGFFLDSQQHEVKTFTNRFYETYGIQPGILGAEAFDAASIILNLLKEGNLKREDIKRGLGKISNLKGAAGTTSFNAEGEALKELFILTIKNGEIVQLN